VAGREFVGSFAVVDVADAVASSDLPDARDPAVVLVGLVDASHEPVVKIGRADAKFSEPCLDLLGLLARDRYRRNLSLRGRPTLQTRDRRLSAGSSALPAGSQVSQ